MIAVTDARAAADKLVALIRDECERVEIAGSIRRGKAEVHDAELVVIPRAGLWPLLDGLVAQGVVGKAIYSDGKHRWGEKQRGVAVDGVTVEIFTADAINWGYQYWLRTGPGPANTHVMKWRSFTIRSATWEARGGYIYDIASWTRLIVPDEATMFTILGVVYIPPHERTLELYESIFKRGHKWGDVSQIAREASTQPAAKPAPVAPKYAPYTGTVYVPKFDRGEIVQVDGQRYAVARIVCNMRSNVVPKGQPFEYTLRPMAAGGRVVYAWEYQITAYVPETPAPVIAEDAPVAPVVESQPVAAPLLLLPPTVPVAECVAQRVNRPQRVTVTPDVIALPASMAAPDVTARLASLADELLDDHAGVAYECQLFDLVREYDLTLADIEPHLANPDQNLRYAAVIALGVLSSTCEFSEALRLLRIATADMASYLVNNALEWAAWQILPEWWEGMTRGIEALSGLCAWAAFAEGEPVDKGFAFKTQKRRDGSRTVSVLLEGDAILTGEIPALETAAPVARPPMRPAANAGQQLALF